MVLGHAWLRVGGMGGGEAKIGALFRGAEDDWFEKGDRGDTGGKQTQNKSDKH